MPSLANHQSAVTTKMVLIGDNGSGKTGALASLVDAGYNVRVMDLDNGLDILANILKDPKSPYKQGLLEKVAYITLTDPMKNVNGKLIPKSATVWQRAMQLLDGKLAGAEEQGWNFGPVSTWGTNDILALDSLSLLANGALNHILSMNARLGQQPHQSDWYAAQQILEGFFQYIFDEGVKCNIVLNAHIVYIGDEGGPQRGYPATLGKALSPKMGSYFNTILMAKTVGSGAGAKHKILTKSQGMIELKNSSPFQVEAEYPLETGLASYFKAIRGTTLNQGIKP